MSGLDAAFRYLDRPLAPLHIGAIVRVQGDGLFNEFLSLLDRRLPKLPRYQQRAISVPLSVSHPTWEDDPDFDVRDHVFRWAVPTPATEETLFGCVARLLAEPLPASQPLWRIHVFEGLEDQSTAILMLAHHCMIDGLSGVALLDTLLDSTPNADWRALPRATARPLPTAPARLVRGFAQELSRQLAAARELSSCLGNPRKLAIYAERARLALRGARSLRDPGTPELRWNQPLGRRRRLVATRISLDTIRSIRRTAGCTFNDVLLCVLAGGVHRVLAQRVQATREPLRALVPVSLRGEAEHFAAGNQLSPMIVKLPVEAMDEAARLREISEITRQLRERQAWRETGALLDMLDMLSPSLVAAVARTIRFRRIANLVITNVPGPSGKRFVCGRPVLDVQPIVPICDRMGLGAAALSYGDSLSISLHADPELLPELDELVPSIQESTRVLSQSVARCA